MLPSLRPSLLGRFQLLCVAETGYLSYDNRSADLLFEIVNRRYESKSLVLTTNLTFSQWPTIFPSATCTTALIDASSTTPTSSPSKAGATADVTPRLGRRRAASASNLRLGCPHCRLRQPVQISTLLNER